VLERRLWDDGYTAHVLGPRAVGAAAVCQGLGLITIVLADGTTELSGIKGAIPGEQILVFSVDDADGGGSTEAVLRALRSRDVIR
jgi:bifunctional enzyme CysN/CysC